MTLDQISAIRKMEKQRDMDEQNLEFSDAIRNPGQQGSMDEQDSNRSNTTRKMEKQMIPLPPLPRRRLAPCTAPAAALGSPPLLLRGPLLLAVPPPTGSPRRSMA